MNSRYPRDMHPVKGQTPVFVGPSVLVGFVSTSWSVISSPSIYQSAVGLEMQQGLCAVRDRRGFTFCPCFCDLTCGKAADDHHQGARKEYTPEAWYVVSYLRFELLLFRVVKILRANDTSCYHHRRWNFPGFAPLSTEHNVVAL